MANRELSTGAGRQGIHLTPIGNYNTNPFEEFGKSLLDEAFELFLLLNELEIYDAYFFKQEQNEEREEE